MTPLTLAQLLTIQTKAEIYETALQIAQNVGLNVSTWQAGDPTRSQYHLEAETLATLEEVVANYVASGFLDYATGDWLRILAKQVFNVDVPEATYATTSVTLTNGGANVYEFDAGDLTVKSTVSGKTYHSISGGVLEAGGTLDITVEADEPGADSSAGIGEIDALVTTFLGVTCTNAAAAVGTDEQDEATTRQQCRDKLGSLSPNGPKDAYSYVARNSALTGLTSITRVRVYPDSETGTCTIYLAGPNGAITEPERAAVEAAILKWATPLCITPTVLSATNVNIAVICDLYVYSSVNKTTQQITDEVTAALRAMYAVRPIGGDIPTGDTTGKLFTSLVESTIRALYPQAFRVTLTAPASDQPLANNEVAALPSVTVNIHFVADP
jgi:hypothetical protein